MGAGMSHTSGHPWCRPWFAVSGTNKINHLATTTDDHGRYLYETPYTRARIVL
jgi:hypothetical protein